MFARARREVIVCSGGIRSPQLLELSGIGQGQILEKHGIKVVQHLSGVGENLQDHLMVRVCFECTEPVTIYDLLQSPTRMTIELAKYLFFRKGMFSIPSFSALAFVCSEFGLPIPDLRIQLGLTSGKRRLSGEVRTGLDPFSGFHLGGYSIYPRSRGSLHIRSRNPNETPAIVANYLSDSIDRAKSVRVIKLLRQISAHPPLNQLIRREVRPGAEIIDDSSLLEYVRDHGETCWHPCGTCKMGDDNMAVVDTRLRVHGVTGLRVADASVMPFLVSSNTNIPTIMIGERAADLIAELRLL